MIDKAGVIYYAKVWAMVTSGFVRTFLRRMTGSSWRTLDDRIDPLWASLRQSERYFAYGCALERGLDKGCTWRKMELRFEPLFGGVSVRMNKKAQAELALSIMVDELTKLPFKIHVITARDEMRYPPPDGFKCWDDLDGGAPK